jgi:NADH-quinone oxidoreductase subunit F
MKQHKQILLRNFANKVLDTLSGYERCGGFNGIKSALSKTSTEVVEIVKNSGLRGRGGAGFPTGMKWGFVPQGTGKPIYLLANADESEPGTFKDRLLMERDPFGLIEGLMIGSWALNCHWSSIYIRGEYGYSFVKLQRAVEACYKAGYLGKNIFGSNFSLDLVVHRGAGAYICGEETGLINSLEGKKGQPRLKPPFPALVGLYGCPTVVNNVETLMSLPWILTEGPEAYKAVGTEKSPGTKLFSASGHVKRPGVYEVELGYPLLDFIENECGGVDGSGILKAVVPGGASVPALRADELAGVTLDYESLRDAGTMLGSGGFIVMDDTTDMVKAALNFSHFYSHESCGQCTPCREGAHWIEKILKRMVEGNGTPNDTTLISSVCSQIAGHTICPFGEALVTPVLSYMKKFPVEFQRTIEKKSGEKASGLQVLEEAR